ncbi:family 43 glycosylhydrolase [Staphylococcus succinus]|uniref:glycoside hydrolase family 43 protein n=1 Tax=Staphylococcus succinus TaxID=61015 RepID=UPI000D1EE2D0|nr:family 43 glycosylhydrolase [Staphylococcus succinus]PTI47119.1 alpha-N-arabinofuranosidase [Staphylococcus succinus]
MVNISNPIVLQRADPFIYKDKGNYIFTGSHPKYDRIILRISDTINGLYDAKEHVIWEKHDKGGQSHLIWAPEIHKIKGKWYIYYAAAPNEKIEDDTFNHRMYVLENNSDDPLSDNWVDKGQIDTGWDSFALDATIFCLNDTLYYVWAQQDFEIPGHSNIYISKMKNPWTLEGEITMLTYPEYDWEKQGFLVNEGPAVLIKENYIYLTYSASATGIEYCVGLLYADITSDLLDSSSWSKVSQPIFKSSNVNAQYGPGHNSFTVSEDDNQDIIVYHARNYQTIEGDPLYDPNRHARAQVIEWDNIGMPILGEPVPDERWTPNSPRILEDDSDD